MTPPKRIYKLGTSAMPNPLPGHVKTPRTGTNNSPKSPGTDDNDAPKSFPLDCLPRAAADMAQAIARTERTPETLAGCCVLGILSASIGAVLQVKSGPDRVTRG
ncbi:MAG: hypothetical protein ACRED1_11260, partial [Limisphaerales bacterium]